MMERPDGSRTISQVPGGAIMVNRGDVLSTTIMSIRVIYQRSDPSRYTGQIVVSAGAARR